MEKGKISSLQMAVLLYPSIIATSIISVPSIVAKFAKNDLWIPPMMASAIGFLTVYIAYELHKLYPKQTVIEFSEQIAGRIVGKIIGLYILVFYIFAVGHIVRGYSEFIISSFLESTPLIVIIASMILLCAFAVQGGLEVLGRLALLFSPLFILPLLSFVIFLSPDYEMKNIFPIFGNGILPVIKGSIVPGGWYSEIFLMAFLLPYLSDGKKGRKFGMLTVVSVMLTLVVVNLTVLFVLGITTSSKVFPLMVASRYVSLGGFFENVESIAMAVWIVGAFIKISVFFYVSVLGTAQWLKLSDYRVLIWPYTIFFVELAYWSVPNSAEYTSYLMTVLPFYGPFAQTILPLFLLLLAVVRKKRQKQTKSS
ncbi:GerAB/ArcD/ProY family transporter [Bacillus benzoevorans]|uniref:Spore germination protein KB n=1 Tax=Bacillus benzoevorans TaxID=1456 RepID=A0A7X0HPG5_9BACI|nr:endospore germination permease [Bacillus benzoevorans]MBB6444301.1 spore germination protein KB [Bacillus benzoevorans]